MARSWLPARVVVRWGRDAPRARERPPRVPSLRLARMSGTRCPGTGTGVCGGPGRCGPVLGTCCLQALGPCLPQEGPGTLARTQRASPAGHRDQATANVLQRGAGVLQPPCQLLSPGSWYPRGDAGSRPWSTQTFPGGTHGDLGSLSSLGRKGEELLPRPAAHTDCVFASCSVPCRCFLVPLERYPDRRSALFLCQGSSPGCPRPLL